MNTDLQYIHCHCYVEQKQKRLDEIIIQKFEGNIYDYGADKEFILIEVLKGLKIIIKRLDWKTKL